MERVAKGMKLWADLQCRLLPTLRTRTAASVACPQDEFTPTRCVVFIEPRLHPATEFVLRNIRSVLPSWPILVVHGNQNEEYVKHICSSICGSFIFKNCNKSDLPREEYNKLLTSRDFWGSIPYEWALITQTDVVLMDPQASTFLQTLIDTNTHFTGAPWSNQCGVCSGPLSGGCGHMIDQAVLASLSPHFVGNGGLSFRHVPSLLDALQSYSLGKLAGCTNEDVFFCKAFTLLKKSIASRDVALKFAIEQIAPFEWNDSGPLAMGAHKPWSYLPDKLCAAILARVV